MRPKLLIAASAFLLLPIVTPAPAAEAAVQPNIFFYNLDDLRDKVPSGVDPLQFMPKLRQWMAVGTRYSKMFVAEPSCCPSRSSLMTGRYPHNNGVRLQSQGPSFDYAHSMACYLQNAGYSTYEDGKFLTTWPKTSLPPCFTHSTVMWGGYNNVQVKVDGVSKTATGYSTTYLGARGREYIQQALTLGKPFLLYETPQAPHEVDVTNPDGTTSKLAVPEAKYASVPVGSCAGPPEPDRSDKPAYVRNQNHTVAESQALCESNLRAIMTADDEFAATLQLLASRGVLDNTLVIFSSDNGLMWGEHGRHSKFVPYEPSLRIPLWLRWPGHIPSGTNTSRTVSYLDLLPTMLQAASVTLPTNAPRLDGESLLGPSSRTVMFSEYYLDSANGGVPTWKMVRTATVKYIQTYDATGAVIFREYYDLVADPIENTNLLRDGNTANDPTASQITTLTNRLTSLATCAGASCVQ
jgi:N-acetylglucosamine-6-sulfatase